MVKVHFVSELSTCKLCDNVLFFCHTRSVTLINESRLLLVLGVFRRHSHTNFSPSVFSLSLSVLKLFLFEKQLLGSPLSVSLHQPPRNSYLYCGDSYIDLLLRSIFYVFTLLLSSNISVTNPKQPCRLGG